jgi:hypothetical protein
MQIIYLSTEMPVLQGSLSGAHGLVQQPQPSPEGEGGVHVLPQGNSWHADGRIRGLWRVDHRARPRGKRTTGGYCRSRCYGSGARPVRWCCLHQGSTPGQLEAEARDGRQLDVLQPVAHGRVARDEGHERLRLGDARPHDAHEGQQGLLRWLSVPGNVA